MAQQSGKELALATLKGELPEVMPAGAFFAMESGVELTGSTRKDIRVDPDKYVQTCVAMQEIIHSDVIISAGSDYAIFAQAAPDLPFSDKEILERGRKAMPLLDRTEDLNLFSLDHLDVDSGRFAFYMELSKKLVDNVPDSLVAASIYAPWTMATQVRGLENLIYDTRDNPEFVRKLLDFCTGFAIKVGLALASTGIALLPSDPAGGCSSISPSMFREWSKPRYQELITAIMPETSAVILHVCGNTNPILEDLCSLEADALSIDSITSLSKAMEAAQGRMTIMGNVPTDLFVTGTAEEMEGAVKECFENAKGKGKFIIFPACQIPWNATIDRIKGYMEMARRYAEQYA